MLERAEHAPGGGGGWGGPCCRVATPTLVFALKQTRRRKEREDALAKSLVFLLALEGKCPFPVGSASNFCDFAIGGVSLSLEHTGALERRGLFSRFSSRLDGTPGDLSSPLKGDLDLERSRLSVGAAQAVCISMEVHWSVSDRT
ncbi:hypothetical protein MRX96_040041 [Rhipicephalus microplus]